ncbi:MAG TPA: hypothetical protein VGV17_16865 [Bosea sp. (in: a-proteobacteria)]|uniref:WAP domain-containing protein n=1 Tax=Bosea eneae TaxID=151454 RepID=A0ABW0IZD1_9HYPH|nr:MULTISPECIES: hypothetical protein [unclassified Bosea (in: a-proteobacteria)]HEV2555428.1 hypothetical protein [Bosea sp. (in: a-proteobacteria)]
MTSRNDDGRRPCDDELLKVPSFLCFGRCAIFGVMKLRLVAHCLILALFVAATTLAAFVSPARAGFERADTVEMAMLMDGAMPCCPTDHDKAKDCTTNCPALSFCLTKCFASEPTSFVTLARAFVAELGLTGDEATRQSRPFEPPARPPRS